MGRVPFFAYPNSPYSFYASPAEAYFHRPHRPFSPASSSAPRPSPSSPSVINVPVYDSPPSRPSSSPPQPPPAAAPLVDPSSAATRIQSHFRGFCVRKHHPLLHLRTIARARKQLEDLQSELETPEFSLKVRASEKERLRFNESVMAIILRLDAIEGSMAEVRSQRKEATRMAIKLQDAIDAIMMQKDEIAALDSMADKEDMAPNEDAVLIEQALHPEAMCAAAEQDMSLLMEETSGSDASHGDTVATHAAEEEVGNGIDAVHVETHENHMQNDVLDIKVDQDTCVDDMVDAGDGSAKRESTNGTYRCMDVVQEGISQAVEAQEKCDYPHYGDAAQGSEYQGPLTCLDRLRDGNCSLNGHNSPEFHRYGCEERSNEAHEANSIDAQARTVSMVETPFAPQDNAILQQLSEDCRQLKSLVGKLLVQNKAQSNILCVLAERLEMLERQQQRACQHDRHKMREKRKLKKGSKRSVKHNHCEEY